MLTSNEKRRQTNEARRRFAWMWIEDLMFRIFVVSYVVWLICDGYRWIAP